MISSAGAAAVINVEVSKAHRTRVPSGPHSPWPAKQSCYWQQGASCTAATLFLLMLRDLQYQPSQGMGLPERQRPHWAAAEHWQRRQRRQQGCSALPETLQKPCRLLCRRLFPQCCTSAERPRTSCSSSPQEPLRGHRLQVWGRQQLACCVWGLHCAAGLRGLWALHCVCLRETAAQNLRRGLAWDC